MPTKLEMIVNNFFELGDRKQNYLLHCDNIWHKSKI